MRFVRRFSSLLFVLLSMTLLPAMAQDNAEVLTIYSGRSESLVAPLLEQFTAATGVQVEVLYGDTAALASQLLEEGANSPADVYFAQDGGALGAVAQAGLLDVLPSDILERVPAQFQSPEGFWVGVSGRARVLVYNPAEVESLGLELPASILDLANPEYAGLVGWAPTNASFQANVTAMRVLLGEEAAAAWLEGMVANGTIAYEGNTQLNEGVIAGDVVFGITNHYYMYNILKQNPDADASINQHFFPAGDAGALVNVAGASVLASSDQPGLAQRFILYLLGNDAQNYFAQSTSEYPMVAGIPTVEGLPPISEIEAPAIDLSSLSDLQGTIDLIESSGALDN
jgi:iron(III) transport system substrate-binding protein